MFEKISPYYLTFPIQPIMGGFYAWPGQPIWKDDEDEDKFKFVEKNTG